jgi:tetratricopeptide (TPR) repeat protein
VVFITVAAGQKIRPSMEQVTIETKLIDGTKYALLGEWDKAEAAYRTILDEDPQNSAACYELSRTLEATGKYAEALTYIRKAIRIEPDNEWYLLMEADMMRKHWMSIPPWMSMID